MIYCTAELGGREDGELVHGWRISSVWSRTSGSIRCFSVKRCFSCLENLVCCHDDATLLVLSWMWSLWKSKPKQPLAFLSVNYLLHLMSKCSANHNYLISDYKVSNQFLHVSGRQGIYTGVFSMRRWLHRMNKKCLKGKSCRILFSSFLWLEVEVRWFVLEVTERVFIHLSVLPFQFKAPVWICVQRSLLGYATFKSNIFLLNTLEDNEIFPCTLNYVKSLFLRLTFKLINLTFLCQ